MPTFKHPCPYCDKLIDKIVAACPYCGRVDPFAPKRCLNCRKIVEDLAWVVCPSCGASLVAPPPGTGAGAAPAGAAGKVAPPPPPGAAAPAAPTQAQPAPPPPAPAGKCAGCGAPLPAGARFCTICGTMAG
jgi:RNA polymerase subunit RPABC4/transcription elongation factor Spt4